jgi:hypothetical protein
MWSTRDIFIPAGVYEPIAVMLERAACLAGKGQAIGKRAGLAAS